MAPGLSHPQLLPHALSIVYKRLYMHQPGIFSQLMLPSAIYSNHLLLSASWRRQSLSEPRSRRKINITAHHHQGVSILSIAVDHSVSGGGYRTSGGSQSWEPSPRRLETSARRLSDRFDVKKLTSGPYSRLSQLPYTRGGQRQPDTLHAQSRLNVGRIYIQVHKELEIKNQVVDDEIGCIGNLWQQRELHHSILHRLNPWATTSCHLHLAANHMELASRVL